MGILDVPFRLNRVQRWAYGLRPSKEFPVIAVPPTLVRGTSTSSVNPSFVNGASNVPADSSLLTNSGSIFVPESAGGASGLVMVGRHVTQSGGTRNAGNAPLRVSFQADAAQIDFAFTEARFGLINVLVDGEILSREVQTTLPNTGNNRYYKLDFGTNAITYEVARTSLGVTSGGTGHAAGDIITLDGGAGTAGGRPAKVIVGQVSGGVAAGFDIVDAGAYTSLPTSPFSQVSTTGAGTGVQISNSFYGVRHSTQKMRQIELLYTQPAIFLGLVVPSTSVVLPRRALSNVPKVCFVGDSIQAGTYLRYVGGHIGSRIAQRLGLWDNHSISAIGGTGWITGGVVAWSAAARVQDVIDMDADIYVWIGSQNDGGPSTALSNAVRDTLNAVMAARPSSYHVGIGNVLGASPTLSASIGAGFAAASNQRKVRYIDNQSPAWLPASVTSQWGVVSDLNHLGQEGQDRFADLAAHSIALAVMDMVA